MVLNGTLGEYKVFLNTFCIFRSEFVPSIGVVYRIFFDNASLYGNSLALFWLNSLIILRDTQKSV